MPKRRRQSPEPRAPHGDKVNRAACISLLNRIKALDASRHADKYLPFVVYTIQGLMTERNYGSRGKCGGQVHKDLVDILRDCVDSNGWPCFVVNLGGQMEPKIFELLPRNDHEERTISMDAATQRLIDRGIIPKRHGDLYPMSVGGADSEAFGVVDRNAAPCFGVTSVGVHLNCYLRTKGGDGTSGISLWMAQRSADKANFPSLWDPTVAGGQPVGMSLLDNLIKEAGEEAGISPDLVREATSVGCLSQMTSKPDGTCMKQSLYYAWDLEVGPDFAPRAADGEVAKFELWSAAELEEEVRRGDRLRPAMILVVTDFLVRHGVITPDNEPDYAMILAAMHRERLAFDDGLDHTDD